VGSASSREKVRVVVTGKGGVGKTTLAALLACCFAREGREVLAVDGDPQQNLAATLGVPESEEGSIVPLSERKDYIAEKSVQSPGGVGSSSSTPTRPMSSTASVTLRARGYAFSSSAESKTRGLGASARSTPSSRRYWETRVTFPGTS